MRPGPSVYQTTHALLCDTVRCLLRDAVESRHGGWIGALEYRAAGTLYALLAAHPVDRRGRCRSCRRRGVLVGHRSRRCRVYIEANYWLHCPELVLRRDLVDEVHDSQGRSPASPGEQP